MNLTPMAFYSQFNNPLTPGFALGIFKMGSWNHKECTGNIIIKDVVRQICISLQNSVYLVMGTALIQTLNAMSSSRFCIGITKIGFWK